MNIIAIYYILNNWLPQYFVDFGTKSQITGTFYDVKHYIYSEGSMMGTEIFYNWNWHQQFIVSPRGIKWI